MAPTFRVRRLSKVGPPVLPDHSNDSEPPGLITAIADRVEAVYEVEAQDETLTHDEVMLQLISGRLGPTDLVHVDGQWTTLGSSVLFAEAAARHEAKEPPVMWFVVGALALSALVLYLVFGS